MFGSSETTTGGNALKFYCSVRLDIRKGKPLKRGEELIGSNVRVKVVKNKLAPPFREAHFEILYGTGVNKLGELVDAAERLGIMSKNGSWYSYDGERLGQGRDKVLTHLVDNPGVAHKLTATLRESGLYAPPIPPGAAQPEKAGAAQPEKAGAAQPEKAGAAQPEKAGAVQLEKASAAA